MLNNVGEEGIESDAHALRRGALDVSRVAVVVLVTVQLLRVLFPITYNFGEENDLVVAGLIGLLAFLAPLALSIVRRVVGARRATELLTYAAATGFGATWLVHGTSFPVVVVACGIAMLALTSLIVDLRAIGKSSMLLVAGIVCGLALDTALRSAFYSWDIAWQSTTAALVVSIVEIVVVVGLTNLCRREPSVSEAAETVASPSRMGLLAVGPYLYLQVLFVHNIAFVASAASMPLARAATIVLLGDMATLVVLAYLARLKVSRVVLSAAGAVTVASCAAMTLIDGGVVLIALLGASVGGTALFASALGSTDTQSGEQTPSSGLWLGLGTFVFGAFALMYQLHYEMPLPFSNRLIPVVAAVVLAGAALRCASTSFVANNIRAWALVPVALLLVPVVTGVTREANTVVYDATTRIRVLDYNIHSAVDTSGRLNLEAIADVIRSQDPDVVTLQEVGRGWAISGATDIAEWLSNRLGMSYVWSPAADGQFGNIILTHRPILESSVGKLSYGEGTMDRSYAMAWLDLGNGKTVSVVSTHLQHDDRVPTRVLQINELLDAVGTKGPTIIAGDMNARPGTTEISMFSDAGYNNAQDATGKSDLITSYFPDERIDWIFGSPSISWSDFDVLQSSASDHLPLVVTANIG